MTPDGAERLRQHLREQYRGIFDEAMIECHIAEYVDTTATDAVVGQLLAHGHLGRKLLDVGCGYGSLVLSARQAGIDAHGIELAPFEVEFARARLRQTLPQDQPEEVYVQGSALALPFPPESFAAVTLMNVLEHVPDYRQALREAVRVLRHSGRLYVVCPNYFAFRQEAHYLVPWLPLLPRRIANTYLKMLGRNPSFFVNHIYYCTNWGVLGTLSSLSLKLADPATEKLSDLSLIRSERARHLVRLLRALKFTTALKLALKLRFFSPFKHSVTLYGEKQ